jgi:hypothetical protein
MRISLQRTLGFVVRALAALLALTSACVTAGAEVLISRYAVKMDGFHIGDATLHTDLAAKRYKVQVSANFGMLLISTEIQGKASGTRSGATLTPEHFQMVTSGSDEDTMKVDFSKPADASAGTLRSPGAFDPLSALLAASYKPQPQLNHPCDTMLPIFTGRDRYVLEVQPAPAGAEKAESGLKLCQITLSQAFAGGTKLRQYKWKIAFARSAKRHFWLVERVALPTKMGMLTIERTETAMSAR